MKKTFLTLIALAMVFSLGITSNPVLAGSVSGVVIDADGNAVEGAIVSIQGLDRVRGERPFNARFETGENGVFGWRQVPPGNYLVTAGAREFGMARERVVVRGDQNVRLRLQLQARGEDDRERPEREFGSIVGQVIDADGAPVEGAVVRVAALVEGRRGARRVAVRAVTNARGMFEFARVPAGNVLVAAGARGAGVARARAEVVADEALRLRLQLEAPDDGGRGGGLHDNNSQMNFSR